MGELINNEGQSAEKLLCSIFLQASCGQVEVVGTPHATNGVRHLVKSVVRGLKACQVSASHVLPQSLRYVHCQLPHHPGLATVHIARLIWHADDQTMICMHTLQ